MKIETVNRLKSAADALEIEVTVRECYSGRGMYGDETTGLVLIDLLDLAAIASQAGYQIGSNTDPEADPPTEAEEFAYALRDLRSDSMGRQVIVY